MQWENSSTLIWYLILAHFFPLNADFVQITWQLCKKLFQIHQVHYSCVLLYSNFIAASKLKFKEEHQEITEH